MTPYTTYLEGIDKNWDRRKRLLRQWASVNSGSYNLRGLEKQLKLIEREFNILGGEVESLPLKPQKLLQSDGAYVERPLGRAYLQTKRPRAPIQVFCFGHMDTVFPPDSDFQKVEALSAGKWRGPGVSDLKGGLLILHAALETLEKSPYAKRIGWRVFINPDEELGSPGSGPLFKKLAKGYRVGLGFEPALSGGVLAAARRGSGNFSLWVGGKSSHVGRHFEKGRSASHALVHALEELLQWSAKQEDLIFNIGRFAGGGPVNVVADGCQAFFNIRVRNREQQGQAENKLRYVLANLNRQDGIRAKLQGTFAAPPKVFDKATQSLAEAYRDCGGMLGQSIEWRDTGGVCDGNRLAAAGLVNLDTLGAVGGDIHTQKEYIELDSLKHRAKLTALYLMRLADGSLKLPEKGKHAA